MNLVSLELTYFCSGLLFAAVVQRRVWDYALTVTLVHVAITSLGEQKPDRHPDTQNSPHKCRFSFCLAVMLEFPMVWQWWLALGKKNTLLHSDLSAQSFQHWTLLCVQAVACFWWSATVSWSLISPARASKPSPPSASTDELHLVCKYENAYLKMFMKKKRCILNVCSPFLGVSRPIRKELFSAGDLCRMALSLHTLWSIFRTPIGCGCNSISGKLQCASDACICVLLKRNKSVFQVFVVLSSLIIR